MLNKVLIHCVFIFYNDRTDRIDRRSIILKESDRFGFNDDKKAVDRVFGRSNNSSA